MLSLADFSDGLHGYTSLLPYIADIAYFSVNFSSIYF